MFRIFPDGKDFLNLWGWPTLAYLALSMLEVSDMGATFAGELSAKGYGRVPVPRPFPDGGVLEFPQADFDTGPNVGWPEVRSVGAFSAAVGGVAICAWDLDDSFDMSMSATVLTVQAVYQLA